MSGKSSRYDPWEHLGAGWPSAVLVIEPLAPDLLGETSTPPLRIALSAQSSAAQRRCTLAHEIVHLERGLDDVGRWADREERQVHAEASRRLISTDELADAIRDLGGTDDLFALAAALDVDTETIRTRLGLMDLRERRLIRDRADPELWSVA
jgi:IrrE N-terminal-like domain